MLHLLVLLSTCLQQSGGLLESVDGERGGRHWIDQQPAAAKSPEESLACFQIEPGSRIELVAAEPMVFDPVWIDFDHQGRMFAAEYGDYPIGPVKADGTEDTSAKSLSKIVLLEDEDGDGRMDKRTVFADDLTFCHSFMPLMDGILACAQTEILFLKDTDGDNVADVREVWFNGFTPAHPQMQIGCPRWGLDNWIYLTYAPGNVRCRRAGFETEEPVKMPRQDMRFDPLTMRFEPVTGLGQFGNTINNDGVRFFSTNRNPIMMEMIPQWATTLNPNVSIRKRHADVGPSGGDTRVYPLVEMKSNWLAHAGTHTSACGVTAYRGDLWDKDFQNSVFVCEPIGHLVTRSIIKQQADTPVLGARRARPNADFLASTDEWFRPSSLRTGPDGGLYLADMYRMWVEHPKFLPPEIAAKIDWRAGEDKGRIYRIVPGDHSKPRRPFVTPTTQADLVSTLNDANGWRRSMAQQRLVELKNESTAASVRKLPNDDQLTVAGAVHAIRCLEGIGELKAKDFSRFGLFKLSLEDCVRLWLDTGVGPRREFVMSVAASHPSVAIRFKAMLSLDRQPANNKNLHPDERDTILHRFCRTKVWADSWMTDAMLISSQGNVGGLLANAGRSGQSAEWNQGQPWYEPKFNKQQAEAVYRLAELVGRTGDTVDLFSALMTAAWSGLGTNWQAAETLKGLAAGLKKNRSTDVPHSLAELLKKPPARAQKYADQLSATLGDLSTAAVDRERSVGVRQGAIELMALSDADSLSDVIVKVLSSNERGILQQTAIEALSFRDDKDAKLVVSHWNTLTPAARSTAIQLMLVKVSAIQQLLDAIEAGVVSAASLAIDQRVALLRHRDGQIKNRATLLLGGAISENRQAVANDYAAAITMPSSVERGAAVYKKTCSKCHKINGEGHNVGPDISDTRNRSRDALLYDILDPNRRVDPQFGEYVVVTGQGQTFTGLLVSDTEHSVVLRQPEGKEKKIARKDIEQLHATSKSLMPEGIEKDVTVQQMADLLAFLKGE